MKFGLLSKMVLFIFVPAVLGLILITGISYKMSEDVMREQLRSDMSEIVQAQAVGLHAVATGLQDSLGIVAQGNRLAQYTALYETGDPNALRSDEALAVDDALADFINVSDNLAYSALIAPDGKVIAHHVSGQAGPSKSVGSDFSNRAYFREAVKGKTVIADIISATTGLPSTVIAMPVQRDGKVAGVVTVGTNNVNLANATSNKIKVGKKGFAFVYDATGQVVMHPDAKALGQKDGGKPHVQKMIAEKQGRVFYTDSKGDEKSIYYQTLPEEGWIVALEIDREEIAAPIERMFTNSMMVAGVCILIVGFMIILSARGIVRMVAGFSGMSEAVAAGRLETGTAEALLLAQAQKRKDEFSVLGQGMERMVGNIKSLLAESEQKTLAAEEATVQAQQATLKAEEAAHRAESAKREGMLAAAGQLEGVVSIISSASSQLSAQIEQSDRGALESAHRLSEAATAMNEMNATVQEVARNASTAANVSAETKANAENGAVIVQNALQSIDQVQKLSMELKGDMSQLNDHARPLAKS